jgi:CheY-like chemotaxis protein
MTQAWISPGSHAVQFYDNEPYLHRAIAEFFADGVPRGDTFIMVAGRRLFDAVTEQLTAMRTGAPDIADRMVFVDADMALPQLFDGKSVDLERWCELFEQTLTNVRRNGVSGMIRLYGDMCGMLSRAGHCEAALQIEETAKVLFAKEPRLSILCGYAAESFSGENDAQLLAVCRNHSHVISVEEPELPSVKGRTSEPVRSPRPVEPVSGTSPGPFVYVIDDDGSVRQSLARLLRLSDHSVRTFESAEAFLAEMEGLVRGCLVLDVQLLGMSGIELLAHLTGARLTWPVIVMSGSQNETAESEAMRLGARAFLRKPFEPQALLDAVTRALA